MLDIPTPDGSNNISAIAFERRASVSAAANYVCIAAFTCALYDSAITSGDEINLIWKQSWTACCKGFYLFNRYYSILFQIYVLAMHVGTWDEISVCTIYNWILTCGTAISLYAMEFCLLLRLHAMYGGNRKLLRINIAFLLLNLATTGGLITVGLPSFRSTTTPSGLHGCWGSAPKYMWAICLPSFIFEVWMCALVVRRAIQYSEENKGIIDGPTLMSILLYDSMWWFVLVAGIMLVNLFLFGMGPDGTRTLAVPLFHASTTIAGSRILLHTRKAYVTGGAYYGPTIGVTAPTTAVLATIRFRRPDEATAVENHMGMEGNTIGGSLEVLSSASRDDETKRDSRGDGHLISNRSTAPMSDLESGPG